MEDFSDYSAPELVNNGIRRPDAIIRNVVGSLKQFRATATKYGVSDKGQQTSSKLW